MLTPITRLKVCLNGGRRRTDHPALPCSPAELAAAAQSCVAAGAEAVHLHVRGPDDAQSLRADDVGAAVQAVRHACPGTSIGVSTALSITGDVAVRQREVSGW